MTKKNSKAYNNSSLALSIKKYKYAYIMVIPVVLFYLIFMYIPMFGTIIAFKDYAPSFGILQSKWVGLANFNSFFKSMYFVRVLKNTVIISLLNMLINFPAPIILALLFNEVKNKHFKKTVQTISYFPHFISMVVLCGMIRSFLLSDGMITNIMHTLFGTEKMSLLQEPKYFRIIYALSSTWQNIGWDSIIYLAAIGGIDPQLYEACHVDGGNRFHCLRHITLPGLVPTILVLLILRIGNILSVGYEKIILLYNPATYETADVISTYVYRKGLQEFNWSYSTAVGLFNSVINFTFLIAANTISRKVTDTSLW